MSVSAHQTNYVAAKKQPLLQKNYFADKKPFLKHFQPTDITITAVRSVAIQGLMVFNGYIAALELELEDSDDDDLDDVSDAEGGNSIRKSKKSDKPEFVAPSIDEFGAACTKSFVKSLSITTYVRSLEDAALRYFRPQIVSKLIKDVSKSATRKYVRTSSRVTAATLMVKTGMRANILSHVAIFLVEETHQLILILIRHYLANKSLALNKKKLNSNSNTTTHHLRSISEHIADDTKAAAVAPAQPTFVEITLRNASRSGLAIITGGVGAAIGTLIRPGLGTVIGGTIGDTIAYVL